MHAQCILYTLILITIILSRLVLCCHLFDNQSPLKLLRLPEVLLFHDPCDKLLNKVSSGFFVSVAACVGNHRSKARRRLSLKPLQ